MNPLRVALAVIAGLGAALVAYAIVFTHGNPHPDRGDPRLALTLVPLELLVGLIVGWLVFRAFGRRLDAQPRVDVADRMVLKVAHRHGGRFSLDDVLSTSPLSEGQAREALSRLVASGQVREGDADGQFRLGR